MGKQSAHNPGRKRKGPTKFQAGRKSRRRVEEENVTAIPSEEQVKEESDGGVSQEEMVYNVPSMYDKLLIALGSSSQSVAAAYKQRKRQEEGKSDSEEEEDGDEDEDEDETAESSSDLEEEDDDDDGKLEDSVSDGLKTEDDLSASVSDDQDASVSSDQDASVSSDQDAADSDVGEDLGLHTQPLSSFGIHLEHKLTEAEIESLSKKKWRYKWDVSAAGMSKGKWAGTGECFVKDFDPDSGYELKQKLYKHWLDVYNTSGGCDFHSSRQRLFFSLFNSYRDVLHCNKKPFYHKGSGEDSNVMDAYIMHCLNHVFKTRDLVMKNDAKVAKHKEDANTEILTDDSLRDHGFTRPKVLIILPIASIAYRVVKRIIKLTPTAHKANVEHMDRFSRDFGSEEVLEEEGEILPANEYSGNVKSHKSSKPGDFQVLFGGNSKDDFMVGIKFTKRTVKLYSDFYSSDMIVASAVGLLKKIDEAKINKEKDVDYLSSIEVLIIDHADVITMQNWDFLKSVVETLNHQPSNQHGTDIMRIRPWYLDGHASFYRQTILLGYYTNPDINNLFNKHCTNYRGKVKLVHEYKGVLPKVVLPVRQIFQRFKGDSIQKVDDARFEHFTTKVFPKIKNSVEGGTMIFISSYFEYVRIRNFLKSRNASFCLLHEYADQKDISRARVWFFEGKRKIMLYTERAHFYHRYKIRGIQNLIVYSLPERKEFYPEVVNMIDGSHDMACTVLFSPFDLLQLERIVGTSPAKRMMSSKMSLFSFT